MAQPLLSVQGLDVFYTRGRQRFQAVREVAFEVQAGETFGLIGGSGCGKSTTMLVVSGLAGDWRGTVRLGEAVRKDGASAGPDYLEQVQMVFQDPYGSLHPRHTVDRTLAEPLQVHHHPDVAGRVVEVLEQVGLDRRFRFRYPHQLSGGQRQRVAIARALLRQPRLLLLDEPTSALDASVQAEILNLLAELKQHLGTTFLLVSHDLGVISHMCDRVAVMNQGRILETLPGNDLQESTCRDPYTAELFRNSLYV